MEEGREGCAPYIVEGPLRGGSTRMPCPTSQYLSALLLAAPFASKGTVTVLEIPLLHERPYAEMTVRWLNDLGVKPDISDEFDEFRLTGGHVVSGFDKRIPADWSSATFLLAAAAITRSEILLEGLDREDSQGDKAVLDMLTGMGCSWDERPEGLLFRGGPLTGRDLDLNATPDALPALAAAACFAEGTTRLGNVPQARLKETDRIAVMAGELRKLGIDTEEEPDALIVRGGAPRGDRVEGHDDHRVVMALAAAGLGAEGETRITTADSADVTFPGFFELLERLKLEES